MSVAPASIPAPEDVIAFWMDAGPKRWFSKDTAFDDAIRARFGDAVAAARGGAYDHWAESRAGRLALVILLDQFSRNLYRDSPLAFAADAKALSLARQAIAAGDFEVLPKDQAQWLMLPFEHHEGMAEQDYAVALCEKLGDTELLKYAHVHRDIIRDFGRFPHRNGVLGRKTTPEERAFLDEGGFKG